MATPDERYDVKTFKVVYISPDRSNNQPSSDVGTAFGLFDV
jgi:hypothetical protein